MAADLITIGRVVRPHGIDGTLKIFPLTDFPQHFETLEEVFLVKERTEKVHIEQVRFHKGHILLKVAQCHDRACAEKWTGAFVSIDSKDLWPLKEGEYYQFQIEGLNVVTEEGKFLGKVKEIISTGSNDVYIVGKGEEELLLPATKEVIKSIDLEKKVILVHLMEGLID